MPTAVLPLQSLATNAVGVRPHKRRKLCEGGVDEVDYRVPVNLAFVVGIES
jgi:hypothetical protein